MQRLGDSFYLGSANYEIMVLEAHCQAVLSQVLTAMTVEALRGNDESFDPFFCAGQASSRSD